MQALLTQQTSQQSSVHHGCPTNPEATTTPGAQSSMAHAAQGLGTAAAKTKRTTRSTTAMGKPTKPTITDPGEQEPRSSTNMGPPAKTPQKRPLGHPRNQHWQAEQGLTGVQGTTGPPHLQDRPQYHGVLGSPLDGGRRGAHNARIPAQPLPQHRLQPWDLTTDIGHSSKHRTRRSSTEQPKERIQHSATPLYRSNDDGGTNTTTPLQYQHTQICVV